MGQYDPAPERKGEFAVRESLGPEGGLTPSEGHTSADQLAGAQNGLTARRDGHFFKQIFEERGRRTPQRAGPAEVSGEGPEASPGRIQA